MICFLILPVLQIKLTFSLEVLSNSLPRAVFKLRNLVFERERSISIQNTLHHFHLLNFPFTSIVNAFSCCSPKRLILLLPQAFNKRWTVNLKTKLYLNKSWKCLLVWRHMSSANITYGPTLCCEGIPFDRYWKSRFVFLVFPGLLAALLHVQPETRGKFAKRRRDIYPRFRPDHA